MDGRALTVSEVERIADLESREVLLAKLAGAMKGNLSQAAALFAAPASQVARLAAALQEKKANEARRFPRRQPRHRHQPKPKRRPRHRPRLHPKTPHRPTRPSSSDNHQSHQQ